MEKQSWSRQGPRQNCSCPTRAEQKTIRRSRNVVVVKPPLKAEVILGGDVVSHGADDDENMTVPPGTMNICPDSTGSEQKTSLKVRVALLKLSLCLRHEPTLEVMGLIAMMKMDLKLSSGESASL